MKKLLLPLALLFATATLAQDRMTPDLLWSLKRVGGEGVSEDGKTVFYSARTYNTQTEKSSTKLYALDVKTGKKRERSEPKSIFQRDGAVWYAMDEKSIYRSIDNGKTWKPMYANPEGAENYRISPDGKFIAYTREVMIKPTLAKDIYPDLPKSTAQIYTDLNYRHWDTWEDGKYAHLFIAPMKGGKEKDLTYPRNPLAEQKISFGRPTVNRLCMSRKRKQERSMLPAPIPIFISTTSTTDKP